MSAADPKLIDGYVVTRTKETALNTGRPLYSVHCKICLLTIHEATTSPTHQAAAHERDVRGHMQGELDQLHKENTELRAEVERLRKACGHRRTDFERDRTPERVCLDCGKEWETD